MRSSYFFVLCVVVASGCSALVNPDESELGNPVPVDGGSVDMNADAESACVDGCDDGVSCTIDTCNDDECDHAPNNDACSDGERCHRTRGCIAFHCEVNDDCNDGAFCNGIETCDPEGDGSGCIPGTAIDCSDPYACTIDACSNDASACTHAPNNDACSDSVECTVDTCDHTSPSSDSDGCVFTPDNSLCGGTFCMPGATCSPEIGCVGGSPRVCEGDADPCTDTACSEEEMMCVHVPHDGDNDTYAAIVVPGSACSGGNDCDDHDENVHPGATEICNHKDDDCDGTTDEDCEDRPESCDAPWPITLDFSGHGHVNGNIADFNNDESLTCDSSTGEGHDAVFYIDLFYTADVVVETVGSTFDTVLAVGTECTSDAFERSCNDDIAPADIIQSRVFLHRAGPRLPAITQRIYIIVKAYSASSSSGTFQLDVRVSAAAGDSCFGTPIDISAGGLLVGYANNGVLSTDMYAGMCAGSGGTGREAVASFSTPSAGNGHFEAWSDDFDPTLYVRRPSCTMASEVGCATSSGSGGSGSTAMLNVSELSAERYNVIVDGAPMGFSMYTLLYEP